MRLEWDVGGETDSGLWWGGDEGLAIEPDGDEGVFRRATRRVIPPRAESSMPISVSSVLIVGLKNCRREAPSEEKLPLFELPPAAESAAWARSLSF